MSANAYLVQFLAGHEWVTYSRHRKPERAVESRKKLDLLLVGARNPQTRVVHAAAVRRVETGQ